MPSLFVVGIVVAPTATTTPATVLSSTSVTLYGIVSDGLQSQQGGGSSTYHFDYGTDPAFGSFSSTGSSNFSGMGGTVAATVSVTASTRYYFRVVATNTIGTTTGKAGSFETVTNLPTLLTPSDGTTELQADTTFSWTYNSGGAAGGQTGYSLKLAGSVPGHGGTGPWYWAGAIWWGAQVWVTSTAQSVTIPQAFFSPNASYTWTVATQDSNGQGPYA